MAAWERWNSRLTDIESLIGDGLSLTNLSDVHTQMKFLESDNNRLLEYTREWPIDAQRRLFNNLVKLITFIQDTLKSHPKISLAFKQSLHSLSLVTLRVLGQEFNIMDAEVARDSTKLLLIFLTKTIFTKVLYSADLAVISVHLWVAIQKKYFGGDFVDLVELIEMEKFPEGIKFACFISILNEFKDPELIYFLSRLDGMFFLHPLEGLSLADNDINSLKAKYCLELCKALNRMVSYLREDIKVRIFLSAYKYVFDRLETSVDNVRRYCFESLEQLLQYDSNFRHKEASFALLNRINSYHSDYHDSLFHAGCIAVEILGVETSLIECPTLVESCFKFLEDRNDVPNYLIDLVHQICNYSLGIFIEKLTQTTSNASLKVINVIIPKLAKKDTAIVHNLIQMDLLTDPKINIQFKLKLLYLCNTQSPFDEPHDIHDLLRESIFHHDESTRILALSVIIESRKMSLKIQPKRLNLIKESLDMGLTIQEPCNRQRFLVLMGKLFRRLKCAVEATIKDPEEIEIRPIYRSFTISILEVCFNSLYIDGYFARRTMALEVIQIIYKNLPLVPEFGVIEIFFSLNCFETIYPTLIHCLIEDSLEETKQLTISVMGYLFRSNVITIKRPDLNLLRIKSFQMLSNINPINVMSASYLFRCITELVAPDDLQTRTKLNLELLNILTDQVEKAIEKARVSILEGAVHNPIHSRLTSIHGLIDSVGLDCFTQRQPEWTELLQRISKICFDASEVVSSIVCNDSPEGFLPMDLKPLDDELVKKIMGRECPSSPIVLEKRRDITSQMLLIFGWKTIKESALILGKICDKLDHSTLDSRTPPLIINCEFVGKVLNYFVHHLKELKHRGAFEQAYSGFSMVVKCIWRKPCVCLDVIESLLDEILSDLANEGESNEPKCITRRSAGLPFVTQAIVSNEPKDNHNKLLGAVIKRLVEIGSKETAEDWQKVHCLNVIRALMKDQRLGERVDSYIEDCLRLAISYFAYPNYSVSNSASMLFSALMVRIFGVNRSKDSMSKKNSMTAKHFFLRFPTMDAFISSHIKQIESQKVLPVILIILRLWPSVQEPNCLLLGYKEALKSLCFQSNVAKIRDVAAQALTQVISGEDSEINLMYQLIHTSLRSTNLPFNHHDGLISLLYYYVLRYMKQISTHLSFTKFIASLTHHSTSLLESLKKETKKSAIETIEKPLYSYSQFVLTVELLLTEKHILLADQLVRDLHTICLTLLARYQSNPKSVQLSSCQDFLGKLIYFSLYYSPIEVRNEVIFILSSPNLPCEMGHFRTILFKFLNDSMVKKMDPLEASIRDEIMNDYELNIPTPSFEIEPQTKVIEPSIVLRFLSKCPEYKYLLERKPLSSFQPQRNFQQMLYVLHSAISRLPTSALLHLQPLLDSCFALFDSIDSSRVNEDTLTLFYLVFSTIWPHLIQSPSETLSHEKLNSFCVSIKSSCSIDRSDLSRKIAVTIIKSLLPVLVSAVDQSRKFYLSPIGSLWQTIPNLLQDNDPTIREYTAIMSQELSEMYFGPPTADHPRGSLLNCSFELLSNVFTSLEMEEDLRRLLLNLINDQQSISDPNDDQERFFDKSKINFIEDPILLIGIARNHLRELLSTFNCSFFHSSLATQTSGPTIGLVDYYHKLEGKLTLLINNFLEKLTDANLTLEIYKMLILIQLWIQSITTCVDCDKAREVIKTSLQSKVYHSTITFSIAGEIKSLIDLLS